MFWLCLMLIAAAGINVAYLNFSSSTNPTSISTSLLVSASSTNSPYSVEFWMRPIFKLSDSGSPIVMTNTND